MAGFCDFAAIGGNFGQNTCQYGRGQSFTKLPGRPRRMKLAAVGITRGPWEIATSPRADDSEFPGLLRDFLPFCGFKRKRFLIQPQTRFHRSLRKFSPVRYSYRLRKLRAIQVRHDEFRTFYRKCFIASADVGFGNVSSAPVK